MVNGDSVDIFALLINALMFIRTWASKPQHLLETWHSFEHWPRALCIYYCHLVWDNVNFISCIDSQHLKSHLFLVSFP